MCDQTAVSSAQVAAFIVTNVVQCALRLFLQRLIHSDDLSTPVQHLMADPPLLGRLVVIKLHVADRPLALCRTNAHRHYDRRTAVSYCARTATCGARQPVSGIPRPFNRATHGSG